MAASRAVNGTGGSLTRVLGWPARAAGRNIRFTVILSVVLICGSFAAAAAIQMRNDRAHALAEAANFDRQRADEIALDLASSLNRYAALGAAFANTATSAETSAALSEAGGAALRNIAVLDIRGELQSELTGSPQDFLPLSEETLDAARDGHAIAPSRDGRSFAIVFGAGPHIVAVELDAHALMPSASEEAALLSTLSGQVVALGADWRDLPPAEAVAIGDEAQSIRLVEMHGGRRLIALHRVAGWPLAAGASSRVGEALDAWYGSLPLYFFFLFGPGFAGAALAVVFVREFERRARTTEAMKSLRATKPGEARLLVRLASSERRAIEAQRSKQAFMGLMSHELRTPLNAIIGFAEVIERGIFGPHRKYSEYARDIGRAGRELHGRIGDILEYADLEAGRRTVTLGAVDLAQIARKVVDEYTASAQAQGIRLAVTLPISAMAKADGAAIRRILGILISNAIAYSAAGTMVRLQVKAVRELVVVGVRDQGVGFSPDELEKLGAPFCRFDRSGAVTGTGLGIAIAMSLARQMGAQLRIESTQGEGTTAALVLSKSEAATNTTHIRAQG